MKQFYQIRESVKLDEKRFGGDTNIPPSPETKKYIESGKAKILKKVPSVLGPTTKFVVIERPNKMSMRVLSGPNMVARGMSMNDKVIMATISDPKKGRIKMFAFHGSHINIAKAMQFAINNKLVTTTKMESVELDEMENAQYEIRDIMKKIGIRAKIGSGRTVKVGNSRDAKKLKAALKKHKPGRGAENIKSYKVVGESVELDEAGRYNYGKKGDSPRKKKTRCQTNGISWHNVWWKDEGQVY